MNGRAYQSGYYCLQNEVCSNQTSRLIHARSVQEQLMPNQVTGQFYA